jgi:putative peptidoglycan lipid II flippase
MPAAVTPPAPPEADSSSGPAGGFVERLRSRRDVFFLMGLTLAAKPVGFVVQLLIASSFGAGAATDAYFVCLYLASFLANIGVQVFTTLVVPLYFDHAAAGDERRTIAFLNAILIVFSAPLLLFAAVLFAFPKLAIDLVAPGFEGETLATAFTMTRIMAAGTILTGAGGYLSALLNIRRVFWLPGTIPIVQGAAMAAAIVALRGPLGPLALPAGFVASAALRVILQLPAAARLGLLRLEPPAWGDPLLRKLYGLARPVLLSSVIVQALFMIDKIFGSLLDEGSVSALGYANTVNQLTLQIFAGTLVTVMFTDLASLISRGDQAGFRAAFRRDAGYLLAIIVPFAIVAAIRSREIVEILYERGKFDEAATRATASALVMYSIGLPTLGMNMLLGRVFHAMQAMHARMIIDLTWLATNVVVAFVLIRPMGVAGLALATSVASAVNVVLALIYLRRRHGGVGEAAVVRVFAESLVAGAAMAAFVAWAPLDALAGEHASRFARLLALCGIGAAGVLVYGAVLLGARRLLGRGPAGGLPA